MHGSNHEKQKKISLCLGSMQYIFRGIIQYIKPIYYTSHILMTAVGSCIACIKILGHFTSLDMLLINEKKVGGHRNRKPAGQFCSWTTTRHAWCPHVCRAGAWSGPSLVPTHACVWHTFDPFSTIMSFCQWLLLLIEKFNSIASKSGRVSHQ